MNESGDIIIWVENDLDIPLVKHEECHARQFEKRRIYSCDSYIGKYLNEIECYTIEEYWKIKELF